MKFYASDLRNSFSGASVLFYRMGRLKKSVSSLRNKRGRIKSTAEISFQSSISLD